MITARDIQNFASLPTPFYFYDLDGMRAHVNGATDAAASHGFHLHYAMKANADDEVLKLMLEAGLGVDCVSGGEVEKALKMGFDPEKIAFAGVGKTDDEIKLAISADIFTLNVESIEELRVVASLARSMGKAARIALRLNPDVDANTHRYITTGLEENKFGISGWQLSEVMDFVKNNQWIDLTGLHFHIGSQITDLEPFRNLCGRINAVQQMFEEAGFKITHINAGGGLGLNYDAPDAADNPDFGEFFKLFHGLLELRPHQSLHFELGRSLVAKHGDLISRVLYVKQGRDTNFLILDAGMTELIRPALYQAVHRIDNLSKQGLEADQKYDVVGPVCESSDCFGKAISLPLTDRGDIIAIRTAGAYGASMSSHYNLRSLRPALYQKA